MGFRKKGLDVYDYTLLQKKGLLEKPPVKQTPVNVDSSGYFDFSKSQSASPQIQVAPAQTPEVASPLSFFDNFAAANSSPDLEQSLPEPPTHEPTDLVDLKVKLEDFEYKLDRLTDKIILIEAKLEEFGNKGF